MQRTLLILAALGLAAGSLYAQETGTGEETSERAGEPGPAAAEPSATGTAAVEPAAEVAGADETPAGDEAGEAPGSVEETIDPELLEDTELDAQTYEENDDVFVPTEEIPADEPIPFPTDI